MRSNISLIEIDKIDLIDCNNDMTDAEERADEGVPLGLNQNAFSRINENDRELRGGCAGRHIAGELLMARSVGDDE